MKTLIELLKEAQNFRVMKNVFPNQLTEANSKLCIVTGNNTSGKSLLRKVLHVCCDDDKTEYIHLSQQGRSTGDIGALKSFVYGNERDESTGYNSTNTILGAIRTGIAREKPFVLMLDEPEIGCSEELAAALAIRLDRDMDLMTHMVGMIIVTHSRQVAKHLLKRNPSHLRMSDDGMTLEQWINRETTPVESIEALMELGLERWRAIEKIIEEGKKKKK